MNTNAKICLITPGHLVSNPRLVKEAIAIESAGMRVHIIFSQYLGHLVPDDGRLLAAHPDWTYDRIDWTTRTLAGKWHRVKSKLAQKLFARPELKLNRFYSWQLKKAVRTKADIYIGHNLGALPVAVHAAKATGAKCGFDAEDLHRHQVYDDPAHPQVKLIAQTESLYLPQLDQLTASSPLIAEAYEKFSGRPVTSILNVFPRLSLMMPADDHVRPLRLFWFSQWIGPERGLETIIEAIKQSGIPAELHLLGAIDPAYRKSISDKFGQDETNRIKLDFHVTRYPDDLFPLAAVFDIGLAAEPGFSLNNKMALSNKLFTYIQCGLALAVSDTAAQLTFMKDFPGTGRIYRNAAELAEIIKYFDRHRDILYRIKQTNFRLGQEELNWETQSLRFLSVLENTQCGTY